MSKVVGAYQVWATLKGLGFKKDAVWEPFIEWFEAEHPDWGPILTWSDDGQNAILSVGVDAESPSNAVRIVVDAVDDFVHIHRQRAVRRVEAALKGLHTAGFQVSKSRELVSAH